MNWRNLLLAAISIGLTLGLAEVALRVFYVTDLDTATTAIHRRSSDPELIYELTPGAVARHKGVRVEINAAGFRDDPFPGSKRPGEYRILVLGDSVTIGFGVAMGDAFPQLLEVLLAEDPPAGVDAVTVLNLGVYGYATSQEIRLLETRGLALEPDLIVIAYHLNDPDVADAGQAAHFRRTRFVVVDLARNAWRRFRLRGDRREYHRRIHEDHAEEVAASFARLGRLSRETGVPVVVAVLPVFRWSSFYPWVRIHRRLGRLAGANELGFIDLRPLLVAHPVREVALDFWHPNAQGHRLIAAALAAWIRDFLEELAPHP